MSENEDIAKLKERIAYLESLLEGIEKHPHGEDGRCAFIREIPSLHHIFERGCMEGHRCAAKIAQKKAQRKEPESEVMPSEPHTTVVLAGDASV